MAEVSVLTVAVPGCGSPQAIRADRAGAL